MSTDRLGTLLEEYAELERRLADLERRLEDTEDTVAVALGRDRVDDLVARVEELSLSAVTHDDVLRVRTDIARLAAELSRVRAELHAELDRVSGVLIDLSDPRYPRRAAG